MRGYGGGTDGEMGGAPKGVKKAAEALSDDQGVACAYLAMME